jgi:acetyltransferase-like isoleucine patch superfamily enzyme
MAKNSNKDVFARLKQGESFTPNSDEILQLREASFETKKILLQLNSATEPSKITSLLSEITNTELHENVTVFTPFSINYGKHTTIGKNVFINFDCVFLDLGGITIEDNVLIAPKVSILTEGHPLDPNLRQSLTVAPIHIKKMLG